jgi:hypothetical protein
MLAGDFTTYASAQCQTKAVVLPAALGFVNNKINPALLDPAATKIASKYLPVTTDPCGKTFYGIVTDQNEIQGVGRADYQVSDKQTMFARYIATTYSQPIPYTLSPNVLSTTTGGRDNLAQTYTFGDTYLISPTTVNSFRAAFDRTGTTSGPPMLESTPSAIHPTTCNSRWARLAPRARAVGSPSAMVPRATPTSVATPTKSATTSAWFADLTSSSSAATAPCGIRHPTLTYDRLGPILLTTT